MSAKKRPCVLTNQIYSWASAAVSPAPSHTCSDRCVVHRENWIHGCNAVDPWCMLSNLCFILIYALLVFVPFFLCMCAPHPPKKINKSPLDLARVNCLHCPHGICLWLLMEYRFLGHLNDPRGKRLPHERLQPGSGMLWWPICCVRFWKPMKDLEKSIKPSSHQAIKPSSHKTVTKTVTKLYQTAGWQVVWPGSQTHYFPFVPAGSLPVALQQSCRADGYPGVQKPWAQRSRYTQTPWPAEWRTPWFLALEMCFKGPLWHP